jgi:phosphate transport system permease protein
VKISAKATEKIAWALIWLAGILAVVFLAIIVGYVLIRGLRYIDIEFLFTEPGGGLSGEGGISTTIIVTVILVMITMVILIPLGVGAAIYLSEYAPRNKITAAIRYSIDLLAGVPSVVFGLFGFAIFVLALSFRYSILSGALTLVCLLIPFLVRSAEEAIQAVPRSLREASLALGATKWQTITNVVLPAAIPGVVTGIILCVGRVMAESACLYVTMGGASAMPTSLFSSGRTMAVHIYYLAMETNALDKALATGAVLIMVIIILNMGTRWLSNYLQKRMTQGV